MISNVDIQSVVDEKFDNFGINKRREIARLFYEICKREDVALNKLISQIPDDKTRFSQIKHYLIERRFPDAYKETRDLNFSFQSLNKSTAEKAVIKREIIYPKKVFLERSIAETNLAKRLKKIFPRSDFEVINSYAGYISKKDFCVKEYNRRFDNLFVIREPYDFFKKCPCTPKAVSCGYHVANIGIGCVYECTYCYMQGYINSPGIIIPANIEDFFASFEKYRQDIWLGSGEFTDSLALDHITQFSPKIIDFFRTHPKSTFEFKTKSANINLILSTKPSENVVVSWSVNPQKVAETNEFLASPVHERISSAKRCLDAGYRIGFHFDPIIKYQGWEKDYSVLVNQIFDTIDKKRIAWISLGTLRMNPNIKKVIEVRFPQNTILDGELILGFDGKLRYERKARKEIYQWLCENIRLRSGKAPVYLCMEDKLMWKEAIGSINFPYN